MQRYSSFALIPISPYTMCPPQISLSLILKSFLIQASEPVAMEKEQFQKLVPEIFITRALTLQPKETFEVSISHQVYTL